MNINVSNFNQPSFELFDLNLLQKPVDGGVIEKEQIDAIQKFPHAESIVISGLKQDTFEYFIEKYGKQFKAVSFWKNKSVQDLSALSSLTEIEFLQFFFNQKATSLWDMTGNQRLTGLSLIDFSKLHSIEGIETARNLSCLCVESGVNTAREIETLKPIVNTGITRLDFYAKLTDHDFKCLASSKIRELNVNPTQFTMDELAELLSWFPEDLKGSITKPYVITRIKDKDVEKCYYLPCKNKRICLQGKDDKRFETYLKDFDALLKKYRGT